MSSIPDDDDDFDVELLPRVALNVDELIKSSLPPAPEDQIALTGDILTIFVYSYIDHIVNQLYVASASLGASDPMTYIDANGGASLPVWFDPSHLQTFGSNWLSAAGHHDVPYAPGIATSGLAFVALAASWIFSGYLSGAFLHKNTLECTPSDAMMVTLRTWAATALMVSLLAWGSDAVWGALDGVNALSAPARGGLTRADCDFIFDSLSVLALWRLMLNYLFGYRR